MRGKLAGFFGFLNRSLVLNVCMEYCNLRANREYLLEWSFIKKEVDNEVGWVRSPEYSTSVLLRSD
jgi:hypothetical protein